MQKIIRSYKVIWSDRRFLVSFISSLILLLLSFVINFYAGTYATASASSPVSDIILDNIPVFDVDWVFVYGPIIFFGIVALLCVKDIRRVPFVLKSIALFVVIRSVFIMMTHLGPFPIRETIDYTSRAVKDFTFGGDLFFSGHTGLPFLMALVFWRKHYWRILFIATSIFFGAVVLMGHLHYTIDVLSAFFITYAIYHLALVFFKEDLERFSDTM